MLSHKMLTKGRQLLRGALLLRGRCKCSVTRLTYIRGWRPSPAIEGDIRVDICSLRSPAANGHRHCVRPLSVTWHACIVLSLVSLHLEDFFDIDFCSTWAVHVHNVHLRSDVHSCIHSAFAVAAPCVTYVRYVRYVRSKPLSLRQAPRHLLIDFCQSVQKIFPNLLWCRASSTTRKSP